MCPPSGRRTLSLAPFVVVAQCLHCEEWSRHQGIRLGGVFGVDLGTPSLGCLALLPRGVGSGTLGCRTRDVDGPWVHASDGGDRRPQQRVSSAARAPASSRSSRDRPSSVWPWPAWPSSSFPCSCRAWRCSGWLALHGFGPRAGARACRVVLGWRCPGGALWRRWRSRWGPADWPKLTRRLSDEWLQVPILDSYLRAPDQDVEGLSIPPTAVDGLGPCHLAGPSLDGDQRLIRVAPCA